jgi:hypothetical protein
MMCLGLLQEPTEADQRVIGTGINESVCSQALSVKPALKLELHGDDKSLLELGGDLVRCSPLVISRDAEVLV